MSNFTVKELQQNYLSKLNTYNYQVVSASNDSNKFDLQIPPFPLPTHQQSNLAIFKLKEFWICNQGDVAAERPGGLITQDVSGFCVRFSGLGFRGTNFTNLSNKEVPEYKTPLPTAEFMVINKYASLDRSATAQRSSIQANSGSDTLNQEVVCSNPSGTFISIEVIDLDDQNIIIPDGFYIAIRFEVEVLPNSISSGNVN